MSLIKLSVALQGTWKKTIPLYTKSGNKGETFISIIKQITRFHISTLVKTLATVYRHLTIISSQCLSALEKMSLFIMHLRKT